MLYRVKYHEGVIEFVKNKGQTFLKASSPEDALKATRDLFDHTREEHIQKISDSQFLVNFKVSLDYHLPLLKSIEKVIKHLRSNKLYNEGRYIDRYIIATIFLETNKPEYLNNLDITREIADLRKAAVVSREVSNVMGFVDYDICIYNYLELNQKEGYTSRIIRKVIN